MWQPHYRLFKKSKHSCAPLSPEEEYERMMDCLREIVGREYLSNKKLTAEDFSVEDRQHRRRNS
jgi:hypothetical protein